MRYVLVVELADRRCVVPVALVRQQPDDELSAHRLAYRTEVGVLRVPQLSQERTTLAIAVVDADGEADDGEGRTA